MQKNITYLLGAGASYNACPILSEQGEKMIELSNIYFNLKDEGAITVNENSSFMDKSYKDMKFFGEKAKLFGTIDTYAKNLYLNENKSELSKLKLTISLFFTIWQLTDHKEFKTLKNRDTLRVDNRYISLLATILERDFNNDIVLKENINFVSWNYDLQLEYAFRLFNKNIKFKDLLNNEPLRICHLNGYHGFYETNERNHHFIERTESPNIQDIINEIGFVSKSQNHETIDISNHINYAWDEDSEIAKDAREISINIFMRTDILIIIGYSFPTFNKDIDKLLFNELKNRNLKIYYQDPSATDEYISQLAPSYVSNIILKKDLSQFFLPYSF